MELLCPSVSTVTPGAFSYHKGYKDFTQIRYLEPRLLPHNAGSPKNSTSIEVVREAGITEEERGHGVLSSHVIAGG